MRASCLAPLSSGVRRQVQRFVIDGAAFSSLEGFAEHFSERVLGGYTWRGNLDAFNDILRGGFGTPEEGFQLIWANSDLSRQKLGYTETVRQLQLRLESCHSSHRRRIEEELEAANRCEGTTVFDWLVEIIQDHGPEGSQSGDGVQLILQ